MHLKKLHLQGFKTFAEKTEIAFSEGVTAIVGPNGSGKSNIADAILWVLGEQKASALRGAKSHDVIFSGSDKRRQSGMAEVSLTVDNSDGTLPLDFNEVTITRRAYRAGDAEYFLNKVPCRLKDIYELFLDTGVGREAYSLVNQSEIDAVLSVNPEDRRGLFEEAAGIKKYRVKKREALRKLESTENNLLRVNDILTEISDRLEPLQAQAELANRYIALRDRLRSIESTLLIIDLRNVTRDLNAARQIRIEEVQRAVDQLNALEAADLQSKMVGLQLADADTDLENARNRYQTALSAADRAEGQRALAKQREDNLSELLQSLELERHELAERRALLADQLKHLEQELLTLRDAEVQTKALVSERQGAVDVLNAQITEISRHSERARAQAMTLARQQSARQSDLARAEARVLELESSLPALKAEHLRLEEALATEQERSRAALTEIDIVRAALADAEIAVSSAQADRDKSRKDLNDAHQETNAASSRRVSLSTRLRTLQDLEAAQEGYYGGVKAVFEAVRRQQLHGDYIMVADCFKSPPGFETALEIALGGSLQDIVTSTEEQAKAAIAFLHDSRAGRATFLPLNRLRPPRDLVDLGRAQGTPGVCGTALEIIEFDELYRPALEVLLGRVIICETLDDALRATQVARSWSRAVTLSGEVVLPTGALTGGRQAGRGAGQLLGRKTEIAGLNDELSAHERSLNQIKHLLERAEKAREDAETRLSTAQGDRQTAQIGLSDVRRRTDFAAAEVRRLEEARGHASRRIAQAESALAAAKELAATASSALESGGEETAGADLAMESDTARQRELTEHRDLLAAELTSARVALATASEKASGADRSLRNLRTEYEQAGYQESRKADAERDALREHQTLQGVNDDRSNETLIALADRDASQKAVSSATETRQALVTQLSEANTLVRSISDSRAASLEIIHKNELKEARLEVLRAQSSERLGQEYDITDEEVMALPDDPNIEDGSQAEVNRLRREMRLMGEVNTGSIEEYNEQSQRHEFLTTQRADLDEARAKLLDGIREIDDSTRGVFMETFNAVAVSFEKIFTRLFGGGKTDLLLTNPADLLETGIEIIVQPPGKKRQNLALLSGGERALTATALLFAFLDVKPSPFCVMDEVDAPLDGANVERFADLLREFGERSQFIIITHNPTTMEAAPIWYGVTMQDAGISRVLSMQVPEGAAGKDGNPVPRATSRRHKTEVVLSSGNELHGSDASETVPNQTTTELPTQALVDEFVVS